LNFESLYGKSDQYVTFSVSFESDDSTMDATATYDVTDPTSNAEPASFDADDLYFHIPLKADDATSGVAAVVLWCKGPTTNKWSNTGLYEGDTGRDFYYMPNEGDGTYYFATRSIDKAGNWEEVPEGDGDTWIYFTASSGSPGTWPNGYSGLEGGGGGCFIATAASD
jgi:hypothetical protein